MELIFNQFESGWPEPFSTTVSGKQIDYTNLLDNDYDITDIAHHLSHVVRYGGAIKEFFSVAQHSLLVEAIVAEMGGSTMDRFRALLHDAHEAYIGDMRKPLRMNLPIFQQLEHDMKLAVGNYYEVDLLNLPDIIEEADSLAGEYEADAFFDEIENDWRKGVGAYKRNVQGVSDGEGLISTHPAIAKEMFLNKYWQLKIKLDNEESKPTEEVQDGSDSP